MKIEHGNWTEGWLGCPVFEFSSRVVVDQPGFERLRLEDCARWCHDHFNFYDWTSTGDYSTFEGPSVMYYYFVHPDDAMAFYLRWS